MSGLQDLMQIIRTGGNPAQLINSMMQQNPQLKSAMNMLSGKSQQQQMMMLENMAKEKGTTLKEVAQRMGLRI